jgi:hypothetical protein
LGVGLILALLVLGIALGLSWASRRAGSTVETLPQVTFYLDGEDIRRPDTAAKGIVLVPETATPFTLTAPVPLTVTYSVTPVTPYYRVLSPTSEIQIRLVISVPVQRRAERMDVYRRTEDEWRWQPSRLDAAGRRREVVLTPPLPDAILLGRSETPAPRVVVGEDAILSPTVGAAERYLDVPSLILGPGGQITGAFAYSATEISARSALVIRNYRTPSQVNALLVREFLRDPVARAHHLTALLEQLERSGYSGLVLDYRGVPAALREDYTRFVTALAEVVHEVPGHWLGISVDFPTRVSGGTWATAGYDWQRLGAVADQVRVVMPLNPDAYAPGAEAEDALTWAVTQVRRAKLAPIFVAHSTDGVRPLGAASLLAHWSPLRVGMGITQVVAGRSVILAPADVVPLSSPASGAACFAAGAGRYCWGTPAWLRARYDLAARYGVGSVVIPDLGAAGNLSAAAGARASTPVSVRWQVTDPVGALVTRETTLDEPGLHWRAPSRFGVYHARLEIAGTPVATTTFHVIPKVTETPVRLSAQSIALSLPDPVYLDPAEAFTKTWRFVNTGALSWPGNTVLQQLESGGLTAPLSVTVGGVAPGDYVDVAVPMRAPRGNKNVVGKWTLVSGGNWIPGGDVLLVARVGDPDAEAEPILQGPFELGGHVLQEFNYAEQMQYAGMHWVKIQARYGKDSVTDFIAQAHAHGFKVLIGAVGAPDLVTHPEFETHMANWMADMAAAGADAIEVWNEPNLPREWQLGHISPSAYTRLLCTSYRAIKAANRNTLVISAAPAPTGYFSGCTSRGCDDLPWLEGLYESGAGGCLDYVGAHHNSGATSPSAILGHPADPGGTHHSWYFLPQTYRYFDLFDGTRQIFYTELGYLSAEGFSWLPEAFSWAQNTRVGQQARWLAEAATLSQESGMVRAIIIWNVDATCYGDCGGGQDPQAGYAIIRGGDVCPACEQLHAVMVEP